MAGAQDRYQVGPRRFRSGPSRPWRARSFGDPKPAAAGGTRTADAASRSTRFEHVPALDGIRATALLAVM
ncbi:MAG: hypothetical protein M0Z93_01050, partial [Actinomycetota bacterium]|nr:hypothetical protein [Actinomycetota bacterium]